MAQILSVVYIYRDQQEVVFSVANPQADNWAHGVPCSSEESGS